MQALIHKSQKSQTGWRVCQVEPDNKIFPVANDLFWTPCANNVVADKFWYDPLDKTIKENPVKQQEQPKTTGSQNL